jgi:hypothetical protein
MRTIALLPIVALSLLAAGEPVEDIHRSSAKTFEWNFNLLIEERVVSDKTSQTLLKLQADTYLTEKLSFFGGVWLRDQLPVYVLQSHPHIAGDSDYINYVDIYGGLNYELYQYFNPYLFIEAYYDRPEPEDQWGTFAAVGFGGTLYSEGKHDLSYYTEWYITLDTYDLESGRYWASESAMKYKYKIYDKTSLYLQAVWNTDVDEEGYGVPGYSDGTYSTRLGIQVDF